MVLVVELVLVVEVVVIQGAVMDSVDFRVSLLVVVAAEPPILLLYSYDSWYPECCQPMVCTLLTDLPGVVDLLLRSSQDLDLQYAHILVLDLEDRGRSQSLGVLLVSQMVQS